MIKVSEHGPNIQWQTWAKNVKNNNFDGQIMKNKKIILVTFLEKEN